MVLSLRHSSSDKHKFSFLPLISCYGSCPCFLAESRQIWWLSNATNLILSLSSNTAKGASGSSAWHKGGVSFTFSVVKLDSQHQCIGWTLPPLPCDGESISFLLTWEQFMSPLPLSCSLVASNCCYDLLSLHFSKDKEFGAYFDAILASSWANSQMASFLPRLPFSGSLGTLLCKFLFLQVFAP